MSLFLALVLASAPEPAITAPGCEPSAPVRDPEQCLPLYQDESFTIYSIESVAVGSIEEMKRVRENTDHCGLSNRIDHLGLVDLGVYDIFNATEQSRACVIDWIKENAPEVEYSKQRFDERFENAPLLEKEDD